jgi:adenylate cyclase
MITLSYPDGRRVRVPRGTTILEASREGGIAHAALCGGRGRCSTCRVRVSHGKRSLPPPSEAEARVLARIGAPPNVRLACQTRPRGHVAVQPLLPPNVSVREARSRPGYLQGEEREIVVLFADLRGFTSLAESRLPYDVVFVLNRYFRTSGEAVERAGGRVDKFIGDGVMALFGLEDDVQAAARAAVQAAREMAEGVREIDRVLGRELSAPLRIGIGIHAGPAIVGEMGWGAATSITAIGDTVNAASRLEQATKDFQVELVISAEAAALAGLRARPDARRELELRGRSEALDVLVFERAAAAGSEPPG